MHVPTVAEEISLHGARVAIATKHSISQTREDVIFT